MPAASRSTLGLALAFAGLVGLFSAASAHAQEPPAGARQDSAEHEWSQALPEGWLVAVSTTDSTLLDDRLADLGKRAGSWSVRPGAMLRMALGANGNGDSPLASDTMVFGAAKTNPEGPTQPFALLPIADLDRFAAAVNGDNTGDRVFFETMGMEFVAAPLGPCLRVAPVDFAAVAGAAPSSTLPTPLESPSNLQAYCSAEGLRELARLSTEAARRLPPRLAIFDRSRGPLKRINAVLSLNAKVIGHAVELLEGVSVGVALDDQLGARFEVALAAKGLPSRPPVMSRRAPARLPLGDDNTILRATYAGPATPLAAELVEACFVGRPDFIEAQAYEQPELEQFLEAARGLVAAVDGAELRVVDPEPGEPIAANQFALVRTSEDRDLRAAAAALGIRWNTLVEASEAGFKLTVKQSPLADQNDGRRLEGLEFSTDVAAAAGVTDLPEVNELMARFYGNEGKHTTRCVRLDTPENAQAAWLVGDEPRERLVSRIDEATRATARPASDEPSYPEDGATVAGSYRLDLHLNWLGRLESLQNDGVIGRRPIAEVAPMPAVDFAVYEAPTKQPDAARLRVDARVPGETLVGVLKRAVEAD
ncbi:hypothetical protein Mal64_04100 [Pseudobythopirellula maris]|uniref:Uncharacterized protein n=1 Tax=Pseudobythopirellula maris TaxID=2527991 RepID=A0A5C5ZSR3_9BACT|nr:hypothetical protein [Pseudobythopirellula maris]TWT90027.1 hypothetical protein Mal64_04100 [Pseudobythopirellula maris]